MRTKNDMYRALIDEAERNILRADCELDICTQMDEDYKYWLKLKVENTNRLQELNKLYKEEV